MRSLRMCLSDQKIQDRHSPHYYWVTRYHFHSSVYSVIWVFRSWITSNKFMLKRYCWEQQKEKRKKERLGHTTCSKEMLAHGSVNSLLGPLAQRGVQGCMEINQQLTSSHHLRLRFQQPRPESQCSWEPDSTLKWKTLSRKCRSRKWEWQSKLHQTW